MSSSVEWEAHRVREELCTGSNRSAVGNTVLLLFAKQNFETSG